MVSHNKLEVIRELFYWLTISNFLYIIILIILAGITIFLTMKNGLITKAEEAKTVTEKQIAIEAMNFKITKIQISSYLENTNLPSLQYLADKLCEDEEIEYVLTESKAIASLEKIIIGDKTSIFTKIKEYPYEFEINSSLQLASIDGVQVSDSNSNSNSSNNSNNSNTVATNVAYKVFLDDKEINYIPKKEDDCYFVSISCSEGATATWDNEEWGPNIRNLTSTNTVCTLHFISFEKAVRNWIQTAGLNYDSYGNLKNILADADACAKLMSSQESLQFLCNSELLMEEVLKSTVAKNALYNNANIAESIIANSATALNAIKNSSSCQLVSVNGNASSNNVLKTLYDGKAFILSYSHNGKKDGTVKLGSYINGTSHIAIDSTASYGTNGAVVQINKFASKVESSRDSYSSSNHGTFNYYAIILKIDE